MTGAVRGWGRKATGFVFAAEDARRLAAVRIGLFSLLAWRLAVIDVGRVADQPAALFDPVSLFHLLSEMPSQGVVDVVRPLGIVAALAAAAGLWPRLSFPLAFGTAVFLELMLNSAGKIIHNEVLLVLCLMPLLAAPTAASRVWSLRRDRPPSPVAPAGVAYGWPVRTAMVIVALVYLFVGLQKLRYSGVEWVTSENLRWVLYASSDSQDEPNKLGLFIADRAWLVHLMAAGTIALEVGFIACLAVARLRWLFVPGAISLHLGIWLMMDLDYWAQALTVLVVFANWVTVWHWLTDRRGQARRPYESTA